METWIEKRALDWPRGIPVISGLVDEDLVVLIKTNKRLRVNVIR